MPFNLLLNLIEHLARPVSLACVCSATCTPAK